MESRAAVRGTSVGCRNGSDRSAVKVSKAYTKSLKITNVVPPELTSAMGELAFSPLSMRFEREGK